MNAGATPPISLPVRADRRAGWQWLLDLALEDDVQGVAGFPSDNALADDVGGAVGAQRRQYDTDARAGAGAGDGLAGHHLDDRHVRLDIGGLLRGVDREVLSEDEDHSGVGDLPVHLDLRPLLDVRPAVAQQGLVVVNRRLQPCGGPRDDLVPADVVGGGQEVALRGRRCGGRCGARRGRGSRTGRHRRSSRGRRRCRRSGGARVHALLECRCTVFGRLLTGRSGESGGIGLCGLQLTRNLVTGHRCRVGVGGCGGRRAAGQADNGDERHEGAKPLESAHDFSFRGAFLYFCRVAGAYLPQSMVMAYRSTAHRNHPGELRTFYRR